MERCWWALPEDVYFLIHIMVCSRAMEKNTDPERNNSLDLRVPKVLDDTMESHQFCWNFSRFPPRRLMQGLAWSFYFRFWSSIEGTDAAWPAEPGCTPEVWSSQKCRMEASLQGINMAKHGSTAMWQSLWLPHGYENSAEKEFVSPKLLGLCNEKAPPLPKGMQSPLLCSWDISCGR